MEQLFCTYFRKNKKQKKNHIPEKLTFTVGWDHEMKQKFFWQTHRTMTVTNIQKSTDDREEKVSNRRKQ
jgi:hypothetical protein